MSLRDEYRKRFETHMGFIEILRDGAPAYMIRCALEDLKNSTPPLDDGSSEEWEKHYKSWQRLSLAIAVVGGASDPRRQK